MYMVKKIFCQIPMLIFFILRSELIYCPRTSSRLNLLPKKSRLVRKIENYKSSSSR